MAGGLIEYDADDEEMRSMKKIPLLDYLTAFRKEYAFTTKAGSVIMRKLSFLELERITMHLTATDAHYAEVKSRYAEFVGLLGANVKLNKEQSDAFALLFAELRAYEPHFYLPCLVEPSVKTLEEFNALLTAMDKQEKRDFFLALQSLACQTVDEGAIAHTGLRIAERFSIPLAKGLTMENMPADLGVKLVEQINMEDEMRKKHG